MLERTLIQIQIVNAQLHAPDLNLLDVVIRSKYFKLGNDGRNYSKLHVSV